MRRVVFSTPVFLIFLLSVVLGGAAKGQSVYGLNFLGEHNFRGSARYRSLAFSAIAVPDSNHAITLNTASIADLARMTFSVVEVLGMSRARSDEDISDQNRFHLPEVMIAVPLRKGLVFGVGYRTRFLGRADFSYPRSVPGAPIAYEVYKHRSSLFTAPIALAWKVKEWINIGCELQIERGSIRDYADVTFDEGNFEQVGSTRSRGFSATSWSAAVLIRPIGRFYIGALWDGNVEYDVEESWEYSRAELDSTALWEFSLPVAYGLGFAVGLSERWWVTSQFWKREAPDPTGFQHLEGSLDSEYLIAFGIERRRVGEGGFFSRLPLRLGFYENRWHVEFPQGEPVHARFITMGTGFQLPGGPGRLDLSVEVGQIGSVDNNGLDERMVRIGVGLSASEPWTRRKGERGR